MFPISFHHPGKPILDFKGSQIGRGISGTASLVVGDSGSAAYGDDTASVDGAIDMQMLLGLKLLLRAVGNYVENSGVSAMHLVLLPKIDQALMFDATIWKISKLKLPGPPCRKVEGTNEENCWCHSILMDVETGKIRPLRVEHDTWCSSGALDVNGRLVTLADGRFMVFGGRDFPTFEFIPPQGQKNTRNDVHSYKYLVETHDPVENNLYPFIYLSTDVIPAEVLVCGGTSHEAFTKADLQRPKVSLPGNTDCGRIDITKRNCKWKITNMPSARLMGDAVSGSTGWDDARDPNLNPILYTFKTDGTGSKFTVMNPSNIPRMYHSSFTVLPDRKILIAGSNTNPGYMNKAVFPTELRIHGGDAIDHTKLQVTIYSPLFTTHGISMNRRLIQLGIEEFNNRKIVLQAPMNGNIALPRYYMLYRELQWCALPSTHVASDSSVEISTG
ncbi:aldehyde oxidase GLOX1-like [Hibiscus syriacus]|uniref:aldehyde oxidase GLOX1-like n=1 Tax=Hibiscus syriacus TaxID=106335 RepID=UPI001920E678|nr:aldehyde oxidase GLOX1-like [Hibiscus syriacus]